MTGLACPPGTWEKFLGKPTGEQRILSFYDVLEHSQSSDLREMSRYVGDQILEFDPTSIVAHDLGVPLTLLSLIRLAKRRVPVSAKLTLFNGAFRQIEIFKANHPFRVQWMTRKGARRELEAHGGEVDSRLEPFLPRIRAMYRYIILYGLSEKFTHALGLEDLLGIAGKLPFKTPVQVIGSKNDPYIPYSSVEKLFEDCHAKRLIEMNYGHFPYSMPRKKIVPLIEEFEKH